MTRVNGIPSSTDDIARDCVQGASTSGLAVYALESRCIKKKKKNEVRIEFLLVHNFYTNAEKPVFIIDVQFSINATSAIRYVK